MIDQFSFPSIQSDYPILDSRYLLRPDEIVQILRGLGLLSSGDVIYGEELVAIVSNLVVKKTSPQFSSQLLGNEI